MLPQGSGAIDAAQDGAKMLIKFHRLIYAIRHDGCLEPLGTGLLLKVGGSRLLVTAAHVLDENKAGQEDFCDLVTYGQGKPITLRGRSFRTTVPLAKTRREDRIDIGFILLDDEAVSAIGEDRFWPIADVDQNDPGRPDCLYGGIGYPASMNQSIESDWSEVVTPNPFSYISTLRPLKPLGTGGPTMGTHLLLAAGNKKTRRADGRKAKLPEDLRGMSGGGLWRYGPFAPAGQVPKAYLLGILIERHKCQDGGLLAARMNFVVEGLRIAFPELDSSLPHSERSIVTARIVDA